MKQKSIKKIHIALVGGIVGAVGGGFGGNLLGDKAGRTIYNNF